MLRKGEFCGGARTLKLRVRSRAKASHGCRAGLEGVGIGDDLGRVQELERQEADKGTEDCCCLLKITLNSK
jgi:hypothetical protein